MHLLASPCVGHRTSHSYLFCRPCVSGDLVIDVSSWCVTGIMGHGKVWYCTVCLDLAVMLNVFAKH